MSLISNSLPRCSILEARSNSDKMCIHAYLYLDIKYFKY